MRRPEACGGLSDGELAARALAGEAEAWNEIVRRHSHRVLVSLLARDVPLELAEDLTQEAWLRLIQRQREGRLDHMQLPGLVIAQARWLALEAERTRRRREQIAGTPRPLGAAEALADSAAGPDRVTADRDRLERLCRELERCPARARDVFVAVYGPRGQSHEDVARELGLSLQRVRQIVCEIRARLRNALGREDEPWNI
jgi:RNA polymerase sigma-70 factor (ECF subfamily)